MGGPNRLLSEAQEHLRETETMLVVSYQLVQNPKLLLSGLLQINRAFDRAIQALVHESGSAIKEEKLLAKHKLGGYSKTISEVRELVQKHKDSIVEFSREKNLVICSQNYDLSVLSLDKLTIYMKKAKQFLRAVEAQLE